jgi:hypothetical protein
MFDNNNQHESAGDSMPDFITASFMDIPEYFNSGLTPEQLRHRSQLYQVAYEKARETVLRTSADRVWMHENGLSFGDGI